MSPGGETTAGHGATRRGFLAGVAAGATAQVAGRSLLAGPALAAAAKPCEPTGPGIRTAAIAISPSGKTVWSADSAGTTITASRLSDLARGRSIEVGGAPLDIAIAPDGRHALVVTAGYDRPGLAVVHLRSGEVDRLDVGADPYAVAFAPDGRTAYVAGGGRDGTLTRVDPFGQRVHPEISLGAHPRGLAVTPDGKRVLVALNGAAQVAVVDPRRRRVARRIPTPMFPFLLAVSPDGRRGFVSHNGLAGRRITALDLTQWKAGRKLVTGDDPSGIAFDRTGRLVLVANAGSGTVSVLNPRTGKRRRLRVGGTPRAVAVTGGRGVVADARTGRLSAIRMRQGVRA